VIIFNQEAVITSSLNPAACNLITNSLSIEIAFALVGNSINPQRKILKIFYNWNENQRATFILKVRFLNNFLITF